MRFIAILSVSILFLFLSACGEDAHVHDGHDHTGHDHSGHEHAHGETEGHGTEQSLGKVSIGDYSFTVAQFGDVVGQSEAVFTIESDKGAAPELRAWIGNENGRGSIKSLLTFDTEEKHYHGHLEVPGALPEGSALWLEVTVDEKAQSGHLSYK